MGNRATAGTKEVSGAPRVILPWSSCFLFIVSSVQFPEINIQDNTFHSKISTTTLEIIILGESIKHELQVMIMKKDFAKKSFEILKNIQFSAGFDKCLIHI